MINLVKNKIKGWNNYNRVSRELSQLTDRQLHDIGLTRADIHWVALQSR